MKGKQKAGHGGDGIVLYLDCSGLTGIYTCDNMAQTLLEHCTHALHCCYFPGFDVV